jgi:predicted RecB family nuclease
MKKSSDGSIVLSASDLTSASTCEWAFVRKLEHVLEIGPKPPSTKDAMLDLTKELGLAHEQRVLEELQQKYGDVAEIRAPEDTEGDYFDQLMVSHQQTLDALHARRRVIFQAAFFSEGFQGFADFLIWQDEGYYQVVDTKLARSAKVTALLQLAAYADQLRLLSVPVGPQVSLWLGDGTESVHYLADIEAVFHLQMARLRSLVSERQDAARNGQGPLAWGDQRYSYCADCDVCDQEILAHDDLHQVAEMRRDQRAKIMAEGITTMRQFAAYQGSIPELNPKSRENLGAQARAQVESLDNPAPKPFVVFDRPEGLRALPDPSPGDVFFDFEGDPLFGEGNHIGLDYLFGWVGPTGDFDYIWADSFEAEKLALENFVDMIMERRDEHPDMHVYHYASYEQTHLLQLAQRYGTREDEVDALVREHVLVNLLPIVKNSLRLGQPSYSIKYLEKVYLKTPRAGDVTNAVDSVIDYHRYREALLEKKEGLAAEIKQSVLDYNETDCVSTLELYEWLLSHRQGGYVAPVPREAKERPEEDPDVVRDQLRALVADIPPIDRTANEKAIALAAEAVDYHRRENRTFWWGHFRRLSDAIHEWEDERGVVVTSSAELVQDWQPKKTWAFRQILVRGRFAPGTTLKRQATPFLVYDPPPPALVDPSNPQSKGVAKKATVLEVGDDYVVIEEGSRIEDGFWDDAPVAVTPAQPPFDGDLRTAIHNWAARLMLSLPDSMPEDPALDILRRVPPRGTITYPDEVGSAAEAITLSIQSVKNSYLAVQGPPGTGKTYNGAQVIKNLVEAGWKIGVVAQSHAAVENLLNKCLDIGLSRYQVAKKLAQGQDPASDYDWTPLNSSLEVADFLAGVGGGVVGGTAWTFCNEKAVGPKSLDLIVVEEAGQYSLANTIAVAEAAQRILLLGDPQQLSEVSQGAHPEPIDTSALGWLSEGHDVLPRELGIFLDTSFRMHPDLCEVVSELAYEGKLKAVETSTRFLDVVEPGLHLRPVSHRDNSVESAEEATEILHIVEELMGHSWTKDGVTKPLRDWDKNIIVVAPYNAQVNLIRRELDKYGFHDIPVGTVDKFQGQEAPIAILSMSASSLQDVPRGIDFLLSKNRLNVALSRAQWASYLVYSPGLLDYAPKTPANLALLARFATLVGNHGSA